MRRLAAPGARRLFRFLYRNHNLIFVLLALAVMGTMAAVTGHWLFYRTSYLLAGLVPLCFLWARVHARGLEVTVERAQDRLQVGQAAETRVRLKSRSMFTKLWLELEDQTDMPGAAPRTVITLPAHGTRNWRIRMPCARRGVFSAGPLRVSTGDPFGLFKLTRTFGEKRPLLVLPQPQELPYFWAPAAQLPGEGTVRARTHYVTPNAAAVREYYPGDSYNRIHWRSTARLGRLMVKTFEMDPTSNIWLVLDLHGAVQAGRGDESTEEYGVRIATSLAYHFLERNRMLGLMAFGRETVILDPARGPQQYDRILEALAVARATGGVPLAQVLLDEGRRLGRHTTAIVITPALGEDWVLALQRSIQQGARAAAVVLEPESFGGDQGGAPPMVPLTAAGILTYVIPAGSDLGFALGPAGVTGEVGAERQKAGAR
ncbi:MAG: DUF58 domain-containing protein [Dehalococcoidia bacterium]|nr:DUF58 domain-containing protein [Dehalococcoidia bacterium]